MVFIEMVDIDLCRMLLTYENKKCPVGRAWKGSLMTTKSSKKTSKSPKKGSGGFSHPDYDSAVLNCFLEKQLQLFPEEVASTPEEAADFLEMCFAVVARSKKEVRLYFEEVGTDIDGEDIFSAAEVFPVGDGRYLIVEG